MDAARDRLMLAPGNYGVLRLSLPRAKRGLVIEGEPGGAARFTWIRVNGAQDLTLSRLLVMPDTGSQAGEAADPARGDAQGAVPLQSQGGRCRRRVRPDRIDPSMDQGLRQHGLGIYCRKEIRKGFLSDEAI